MEVNKNNSLDRDLTGRDPRRRESATLSVRGWILLGTSGRGMCHR